MSVLFNYYIETNQWLKKLMDELNEEDGMRLEDAFYAFKKHCTKGVTKCDFENSKEVKKYKVKSKEELRKIIRNSAVDADLNYLDVSGITDMSYLFMDSDFNGDISNWNVGNVTNMHYMFEGSRFKGDISGWNVGNVVDMAFMFANSYFTGDISGWDVSNVTDMRWMFKYSAFTGNLQSWANKPY